MRSALALFLTFFTFISFAQTNEEKLSALRTVKRVAFGSCNNQNDHQPLWKDALAQKPDLWIWGGDSVYADWGKTESVERAYKKQNEIPDYAAFRDATPMIGTWDDHDYGFNEAGGNLSFKKESQRLFQDFLGIAADSPRRAVEGVYTSYEFGQGDQKIKFIMLDNRYHKNMDPNYPILGKQQWDWLENEFKTSTASLHVIVAGLSIFSPTLPYTEEWWHYPSEVNRLLGLLKTYKVKAPLFITGDKHFSSIFKYSGQLEFMSSGMTHTAPRRTWWYLARKYPNVYFGLSYGVMDISWEGNTPKLDLYMRDGSRDIHRRKVIWKNNTWEFIYQSNEPTAVYDRLAPTDEHLGH